MKHSVLPDPVPVVTTIDLGLPSVVLWFNSTSQHLLWCSYGEYVAVHSFPTNAFASSAFSGATGIYEFIHCTTGTAFLGANNPPMIVFICLIYERWLSFVDSPHHIATSALSTAVRLLLYSSEKFIYLLSLIVFVIKTYLVCLPVEAKFFAQPNKAFLVLICKFAFSFAQ